MARMALLCLATFLVVGVFAGPLQQQPGRQGQEPRRQNQSGSSGTLRPIGRCESKDDIFKAGQTYEYKYSGQAETGLGFADSKAVGLAFECDVTLAVPEACEFRMKVVKCEVYEHDGSENGPDETRSLEEEVKELQRNEKINRRGYQPSDRSSDLSKALSQFDIQAQVANGEVIRVIHEEEEDTWVVNFKKGILDALQVRADLDAPHNTILVNGVHGLCPTKYTTRGSAESFLEEKDIDSCIQTAKRDWELSPLTPFYNMSYVSPAMSSRGLCAYKLARSSHVESMSCKETHRLLPLPWNANVSAMSANVTQTLRFVRKSGNAEPMDRSLDSKEITTILYEHENSTDVERKSGDTQADEILDDLVKQAIEGFDIGSPAVFDHFVDELRDSEDLTQLLEKIQRLPKEEKEVSKYFLVQGLVQCNAPPCIRAISALIQSDEIPAEVFEPIVMGLALAKQQDPLFLAEVTRLCEASPSRTCALMVGAMTNKLIEDDEDDDIMNDEETVEPVKNSIQFLTELLEDSKCEPSNKLDKADEDSDATKLIIALKAIGNLGQVAKDAKKFGLNPRVDIEEKIARCFTDRNVPSNVSIAAIEAFRKFLPTSEIFEKLVEVLADEEKPHEVRMAACMAGCRKVTDKSSVKKIMKVMEEVKSQQVKAFMVSHMRSILRSEDPNYRETAKWIKEILEESGKSVPSSKARVPHSFHVELSKFYEIPYLNDDENEFGAQVESSVIFTPKSYMPRSIHFNVSGQAWSEYVNFLETGIDFQGTEDLVEKVLGPSGLISRSKVLRQVKDLIVRSAQFAEELAYKYLRIEDVKDYGKQAFNMMQSGAFDQVLDRILSSLRDVDTSELQKILSHARNADVTQLLESIKRNIPQTEQFGKVYEKLRRINLQDLSEETLIEALEAFGIREPKAREILSQASSYGINVNEIIRILKRTDLSGIQEKLRGLKTGDIQDTLQNFIRKIQQFIDSIARKYNLPDTSSFVDILKQILKTPMDINKFKESFSEARKSSQERQQRQPRTGMHHEEEDEEQTDENENDEASLNQVPWGKNVKNFRRQEDEDDEELDATAFVRIFGQELGFVSLSDLLRFFDGKRIMESVKAADFFRNLLNGIDARPTFAGKMEGIHHLTTGLGLPLQITLNVTGLATVHVKWQPNENTYRKSVIAFEPSWALQVAGGMAVDLPSIHKIETVSNFTAKSEFEIKLRVDVRTNSFDITIEKPDEELDLIHLRHEMKLVKDDEDFSPFDDSKSNEVKKQKCLPQAFERATGLQFCADLETSTLRNSKLLSHGPHEFRVSVKESSQSGLQHVQIFGKQEKEPRSNRFELNVRAPGADHQQHEGRREGRVVLNHDKSTNDMDLSFDTPENSTPRVRFFARNFADGSGKKFGVELGVDMESSPRKHYNASVAVITKFAGYDARSYRDERVSDAAEKVEFNYTVKGSVQTPLAWVNVSSTTAKFGMKVMMEHNLTYYISDDVRIPFLKNLRFPNYQERDGVSKFVFRHGVKARNDQTAYDLRASFKFLTFPLLSVPEPTVEHVSQIRVHRDYRHVGLHHNTTWINTQHELEYFNASMTFKNFNSFPRLSEPATMKVNVTRNDWFVGSKSEFRRESGEVAVKTQITAWGNFPECDQAFECFLKQIQTEAKSVAEIFKYNRQSANMEVRPHTHHRFRQARDTSTRAKKATVTVDSRINKQMTDDKETVYEIQSEITLRTPSGSPKQLQAHTTVGSKPNKDRSVYLILMHNMTATNIPYSFDHNSLFYLSRTEGVMATTFSSVTKGDRPFIMTNMVIGFDPVEQKGFLFKYDFDVLQVFSASFETSMTKPARKSFEMKLATRTKAETGQLKDILTHDFTVVTKMASGKATHSIEFKHPKFESEWKTEVDLYSDKSDSDFDAGTELDDGEENQRTQPKSGNSRSFARSLNSDSNSESWRGSRGRGKRSVDRHSNAHTNDDDTRSSSRRNRDRESDNEENQVDRDGSSSRDRSQSKHGKHTPSRNDDRNENQTSQEEDRTWTSGSRTFGSSRHSDRNNERQSSRRGSSDDTNENQTSQEEGTRWGSRSGLQGRYNKNSRRGSLDDTNENQTSQEEGTRWGSRSGSQGRYNKNSRRGSSDDTTENRTSQEEGTQWGSQGRSTNNEHSRHGPRQGNPDDGQDNQTSQENTRRSGSRSTGSRGFFNFFGTDESIENQDEDQSARGSWSDKQQRRASSSSSYSRSSDSNTDNQWTSRRIRDSFASIRPKFSTVVHVRSLDREIFPTFTIEAKSTMKKVSVNVDIREVPRAFSEVLTPTKFAVKGQIQDQKAILKVVVDDRKEAGIELSVRSQREAAGKIYDRGLMTSGETVYAEVTVTLPTDNTVAIKVKVDQESTSRATRRVKDSIRKNYELARRVFEETFEQTQKAVRKLWSNQNHPMYQYTQHLFSGTFQGLKDRAAENGKRYIDSARKMNYGSRFYQDDSVLGISPEELFRKYSEQTEAIRQYILELIRDTPAGEWVDAFPSTEEVNRKISEITRRYFGPQMEMIQSRRSCLTMESCDTMEALQSARDTAMELARSVDPEHGRKFTELVSRMVRDFLVEFVKTLKEKARKNEAVRSLVGTVDLNAVEETLRNAPTISLEAVMEASKAAFLIVKDLTVQRFDAVQQDRDGSVTITIPHPLKWSSFNEYPRFTEEQQEKGKEYAEKSRRALTNFFESPKDTAKFRFPGQQSSSRFGMSDIAGFPKKNMATHTAMIFGERQVMTFDGKVYSLPESADQQCTYLLARGMRQENFALVKDKDSITLTVPEMVISIDEKNQVRVNGTRTELPVESACKKTRVRLIGDTVEIDSDIGISLKVTGEKKVVIVELSMALWGESAGLLGSNDNEATNDWKMPSGNRAGHLEEFLNSYEVGKKSQCQLVKGRDVNSDRNQGCSRSSKCAGLFGNSGSPISHCFDTVHPDEFKQACEQESKLCQRKDSDEAACNVVTAYRKLCQAEGVETQAPEDCETCNGDHKENSKWDVRDNQRQVDAIVLVSEHRDMASGSVAEKIRSLMDTITRKLGSTSQNVRVALVGFSGAGVHKDGHTHTIEGDQFGSPDKLPQALRTLQFKGTQKTNALEAVTYVLDSYDFRPEATKLMLIFGAEESELIQGLARVHSVQEKLIEQSITLTIFSKYGNEEINKDRDHGMNYDGAIIGSKTQQHKTQSAHTSEMPKRQLSYLAKSSRGAVFQLENLLTTDRSKQQQLEERAAGTILEQVQREATMCKACVCQETDLQQLISVCRASACA